MATRPLASTRPVAICDGEVGLRAEDPVAAAVRWLPTVQRFCQRTRNACADADRFLTEYVGGRYTGAALVHSEKARVGAGFAHVLQEQAHVLLFGLLTGRPVHFLAAAGTFNPTGRHLAPSPRLASRLYAPPGFAGHRQLKACQQELARVQPTVLLPFECRFNEAVERWHVNLADGRARDYITQQAYIWQRWAHRVTERGRVAWSRLFPGATTFSVSSPSITAMYLSDFLLTDPGLEAAALPRRLRLSRANASLLARGAGEFSGPACLVSALARETSRPVLRAIARAFRASANGPALTVGLHLRRGDRAMHAECHQCVNERDRDVKGRDRVELDVLRSVLRCVARFVGALRDSLALPVLVFVASDTEVGARLAAEAVGNASVLAVPGRAVHSIRSQDASWHSQPHLAAHSQAAVKVAADFLGLALTDVQLSIGTSSFSVNAAAMSFGVSRVVDSACNGPKPAEIRHLRRSLDLVPHSTHPAPT